MPIQQDFVRVAVVGCGYWGKNHVRVFSELGALAAVSDHDMDTAELYGSQYGVPARSFEAILGDEDIDAVVIAAPAEMHYRLAHAALSKGKHVLVEKPLALRVDEASELVALAGSRERILMVGHLLQYHAAFLALKELVADGTLGTIHYVYSNRLNLGKFRREENILWSFAPHDLSMILALIGKRPSEVFATGAGYLNKEVADVTTTHLEFPGGERAHVFVSWLHPYKDQRLVVVGDQGMAVFDDTRGWDEKLVLFRHPVQWDGNMPTPDRKDGEPQALQPTEPLSEEARHFLACVADGTTPRTDGKEGIRVLEILDAADRSMRTGGPLPLASTGRSALRPADEGYAHETAVIDQPSSIGAGSKIWHFSHVLAGTRIGRDCVLGQNVMAGPDVSIGDRCKIQNNVSLYKGVCLEDGVFCGPSCVFTNVNNPRAEVERKDEFRPTLVRRGATIGANATIVCGTTLGAYSFIAAGAVVADDVPDHALMAGVPARRIGWMSHDGERLGDDLVCPRTGRRYEESPTGLREIVATAGGPAAEGAPAPIPFIDLAAQQRRIRARIDARIADVLDHGKYIMGPEVAELEDKLAGFAGARHCVSCSSGTDALIMAMMARGIGRGDGVLMPSFTFIATAEAAALLGAVPIFVDVRPDTFNMDPASLEQGIATARDQGIPAKAVVPVDLFGQPADYGALLDVAARHGLAVIADAAQSFGGAQNGQQVGTLAPLTATSFFPAKPLGCYGDGGAVFADDDDTAALLRSVRVHGAGTDKYDNVRIGINGRLDTLQAAILLEKLELLGDEIDRRQAVAGRYEARLADHLATPVVARGNVSAWAQYTIQVDDRDAVVADLKAAGVPTAVYYPTPLHRQTAYGAFPVVGNGLAVSEELATRVLSLPMHPYLHEDAQDRVCDVLLAHLGHNR